MSRGRDSLLELVLLRGSVSIVYIDESGARVEGPSLHRCSFRCLDELVEATIRMSARVFEN
jgi:hypothetical protein